MRALGCASDAAISPLGAVEGRVAALVESRKPKEGPATRQTRQKDLPAIGRVGVRSRVALRASIRSWVFGSCSVARSQSNLIEDSVRAAARSEQVPVMGWSIFSGCLESVAIAMIGSQLVRTVVPEKRTKSTPNNGSSRQERDRPLFVVKKLVRQTLCPETDPQILFCEPVELDREKAGLGTAAYIMLWMTLAAHRLHCWTLAEAARG